MARSEKSPKHKLMEGNQIMFEDFKDKIRQRESEKEEQSTLTSEDLARLRSEGLDPETVTLRQLLPENLDEEGNDLSLMSGAEMEITKTYAATRKYLLQRYPQSQTQNGNTRAVRR